MDFGKALEALKSGKKVCRTNWNGKNQYLFLEKGAEFHADAIIVDLQNQGIEVPPFICIKTTRSQIQCGWRASQSDILSDDWQILE